MIELAIKHQESLKEKYLDALMKPKNIHYFYNVSPSFDIELEKNDWSYIERVSIDNGIVLGFLQAKTKQPERYIESLTIIAFEDSITFAKDCFKFIDYLFEIGMYKIKFCCTESNPAKKMYDKLVRNGRARSVGYSVKDVMLQDGKFYDSYSYEATREMWCSSN